MGKLSFELHKRTVKGVIFISINIISVLFQSVFMPFNFTDTKVAMRISDSTVHTILWICGIIQLAISLPALLKYRKSLCGDADLHKKARHFNFIAVIISFISLMTVLCVFLIFSLVTLFLTMDLWFRLLMPSFVVCFSSFVFIVLAFVQNNISD